MKRKTVITFVGLAMLAMSVLGTDVNTIYSPNSPNRQTVVNTLVVKYGLDRTDVQSALDDFRKQHQADD